MYLLKLLLTLFFLFNISFAKEFTSITLELPWKYQFQFAGYIMAKEKGYYKDMDLDVTLTEFKMGKYPLEEVEKGRAQFGIGRSDLILQRLNHNKKFVQLLALCQASPVQLQAVKKTGITKLKDLKNKKILTYTGVDNPEPPVSIYSMLNSVGLNKNNIIYVPSKTYSLKEITDGTADVLAGYSTISPYHLKKMGFEPVSFHPKDYGFDFYGDILFTTEQYIKQNPQIVESFYKASIKGWEYAFANIDETIDIIKTKYNTQNLDRDLLEFEAKEYKKLAFVDGVEFGNINPIKLEKIANTFKLLGKTKSNINDFSDFIYAPSFYDILKLKFEENGIKLTVGWTQFWQILSFITLIVVVVLYKIIKNKQTEQERLAKLVDEKTKDLQEALDEKALLLKELNHRVKNNMQTIISLLRLQSDKTQDKKLDEVIITVQNRINAMSQLHELLYKQDNLTNVDTYEYFEVLIDELQESYSNNIDINLDIECDLNIDQAIYCGLILNELVTNSLKYAFTDNSGVIDISLLNDDRLYILTVTDNGKGFDQTKSYDSLGLILVRRLATRQLSGEIDIDSINGTKTTIKWRRDG